MNDADHAHKTISRRALLRTGGTVALSGLAASLVPSHQSWAHEDHGAAADFVVNVGEFFFELVQEAGEDVAAGANIHIHSGKPHLMRFVNVGQIAHEVHFGRNPDIEARLYRENLFGGTGAHAAHNFLGLHLEPGEAATIHVWIPEGREGEWELGCFIPGHYEGGQAAPIFVEADEGEGHHND